MSETKTPKPETRKAKARKEEMSRAAKYKSSLSATNVAARWSPHEGYVSLGNGAYRKTAPRYN